MQFLAAAAARGVWLACARSRLVSRNIRVAPKGSEAFAEASGAAAFAHWAARRPGRRCVNLEGRRVQRWLAAAVVARPAIDVGPPSAAATMGACKRGRESSPPSGFLQGGSLRASVAGEGGAGRAANAVRHQFRRSLVEDAVQGGPFGHDRAAGRGHKGDRRD